MMNCNLKSPNLKQGNLAIVKSFKAEYIYHLSYSIFLIYNANF